VRPAAAKEDPSGDIPAHWPKVISDQLGHASVQITMDRYSHLFDHAYSDVSDELEKAWTATETAAETMTTAVVSR
jgi:integrase